MGIIHIDEDRACVTEGLGHAFRVLHNQSKGHENDFVGSCYLLVRSHNLLLIDFHLLLLRGLLVRDRRDRLTLRRRPWGLHTTTLPSKAMAWLQDVHNTRAVQKQGRPFALIVSEREAAGLWQGHRSSLRDDLAEVGEAEVRIANRIADRFSPE